jgi:Uncharacterized protein conserved in bacteria (DUF2252)
VTFRGPVGRARPPSWAGLFLAEQELSSGNRAHARWGDRIGIASYLGGADAFDRAIAKFATAYADQNERDYDAFAAAVSSGRLSAQTAV